MAENPLDAVIAAKLRSELSPEQVRLKAQLEASIAERQPAVAQDQRDVDQRRISREAPQPPLAEPAQAPTGPGWPRAALDAFNRGTSFMRGMGDMTEQGGLFGFGDEFGAGIGAGVDKLLGRSDEPFGDIYREKLSEREGALSDFREDHPVASVIAEVAGAVPTAGIGAAASAVTRVPALVRALVGGGIYGAGASVPGERAEGALLGAGLGAGLGGVGAGVGRAISGNAARRAANRTITDSATEPQLRAAADVQYKIADSVRGTLPVSIVAPFWGRWRLRCSARAPITFCIQS